VCFEKFGKKYFAPHFQSILAKILEDHLRSQNSLQRAESEMLWKEESHYQEEYRKHSKIGGIKN
jgi:hypothetical protein